ncbi:MAG: IS4 family transposase [Planctomycetia bacterium]
MVIVPVMAERTLREIRDQDVQGVKYLRKLGPLLSRLRTVGTERDRAGNRRLFMDQYCALILLSLFSPAMKSLRDLQRASALDKVRKRLGVTRASLGSLSESVAIFDPAPLKEIAAELGHTIRPIKARQFDAVGQKITAVDGTVIETVQRVAELAWTPKAQGKHLSAYRLHTHFEVLSGKAVRIDATSANPRGEADERAVLQRTIEADRCYILDRGYISYRLWNAINAASSSYVCRSSDRTLATVTQANELTDADRAASVVSDEIVDLGWKSKHRTRPDHPVRLICVAVKPHESSRGWKGPHCDGVLRLVTNRLDLPAELIAEMYRLRWMIEMFFRTFKQLLGCKHLISDKHNGIEIQAYCAMIVCMLILIYTGEKPNRAMHQMVWYYLIGLASLKELEAFIKSRK